MEVKFDVRILVGFPASTRLRGFPFFFRRRGDRERAWRVALFKTARRGERCHPILLGRMNSPGDWCILPNQRQRGLNQEKTGRQKGFSGRTRVSPSFLSSLAQGEGGFVSEGGGGAAQWALTSTTQLLEPTQPAPPDFANGNDGRVGWRPAGDGLTRSELAFPFDPS